MGRTVLQPIDQSLLGAKVIKVDWDEKTGKLEPIHGEILEAHVVRVHRSQSAASSSRRELRYLTKFSDSSRHLLKARVVKQMVVEVKGIVPEIRPTEGVKRKPVPARPGKLLPPQVGLNGVKLDWVTVINEEHEKEFFARVNLVKTKDMIDPVTIPKHLPAEPGNYRDACSRVDYPHWRKAMQTELDSVNEAGTFKVVSRSELAKGTVIVPLTWSYKMRKDDANVMYQRKARLCVRGDLQKSTMTSDECYSPTSDQISIRVLLSVAAALDLDIFQLDVHSAYLQADMDDHDVYCYFPPGFAGTYGDSTMSVLKLLKPLYGSKNSGALWYRTLRKYLVDVLKFTCCTADQGLFRFKGKIVDPVSGVKHQVTILSGWFVDDAAVATDNEEAWNIIRDLLGDKFTLSSHGKIKQFLGGTVIQDREAGTVKLSLESYIEAMTVKFKIDTVSLEKNLNEKRGNVTRLLPGEQRLQSRAYTGDPGVSEQEKALYHQGVGTLNFLGIFARPDICYGVSVLASFVQDPSTVHLRAFYHLMGYCWITKGDVLTYRRGPAEFKWKLAKHDIGPNEECGFGDSSFADCFETRRSQTGVILMLNGAAAAW